jgi:hypothetical protein
MCFWGSSKVNTTPAPAISPAPSPTSDMTNPQLSQQQRVSRLAAMRYGLLSTIKTSPRGITGSGADLTGSDASKKKVLGA